jgi:Contractile injection system tube protein
MPGSGVNKLIINAFQKFEKGTLQTLVGSYELQLNPNSVACAYAQEKNTNDGPSSAGGDTIESKRPTYYKESIKFSFTLDNSGVLPNAADGLSSASGGTGLKLSIDKLKKATILPLRSSHAPPFVQILWGDIALNGIVNDFSIEYTYFNVSGNPLRANITLGVVEVVDSVVESSKYQSPDITRMPIIKAGQSLPQLCQEFYDSNLYYIQIAQENKLHSFRRLQVGKRLLFPPLEK